MKQKGTFTKRINYEYNELDTIAEYLEERAAEGWELSSKVGAVWGFRKAEPRKVKFNVEVVDADVSGDALTEFVSFCEADGWSHVFDAGNIQIFENEDLDAAPIHTDPGVKLGIVHERCAVTRILLPIVLSIISALMIKMAYFPLDVHFFTDFSNISSAVFMAVLCVLLLLNMADYLFWYKKAKKIVENGESPIYKRSRFNRAIDMLVVVCLIAYGVVFNLMDTAFDGDWPFFIYLAGLLIVMIVCFWFVFPRMSAKYNHSRKGLGGLYAGILIAFTMIAVIVGWKVVPYQDKELVPPLTLEDLDICETYEGNLYAWRDASPFLITYEGDDSKGDEFVTYDIYVTDYQKIYDLAVDYWLEPTERDYEIFEDQSDIKEMYNFKETTEPAFGADKVYYNENYDRWLLLYPDRVVRLDVCVPLSDTQMRIVAEKLTGEL